MHNLHKTLIVVLFLLFFIGLAGAQKIRTVDGVKVISNGKKPSPQKGIPSKIRLEEDFAIGGGEDLDQSFSELTDFVVDDDGNIYAIDLKDVKIKIFDKSGNFIRQFGQKGQGPGEFDTLGRINLSPDNELVVEDSTSRRLAFFTKEGKFIKHISLAARLGVVNILMDTKGDLMAMELGLEEKQMYFEIKKYSKTFEPLFTLDKIEFPIPLPGTGTKINPMDMTAIYQFDRDGNIYYGTGADYEIKVIDSAGNHIRSIKREFDPVKVTEEEITKIMERIPDVGAVNIKDMFEFPKTFPPYQFFIIDVAGRLFVRTWEKGKNKDSVQVDVFDAQGRYISKFESKVETRLWKSGKMYGVVENEDGFRLIKRYSVVWE